MKPIRRAHVLLTVAVLALATVLLAACGGDDGADAESDPRELLERTFSEESQISSGVLSVTVEATSEGAEEGSLSGTLSGPFESREEGELPLIDMGLRLLVDADEDGQTIEGALALLEDGAFVTIDGTAYEVDEETYSSVQEMYAESAAAAEEDQQGSDVLSQLGVDPASWLTDVSNEGTEDVDGTETVHISGTADIGQIVADTQSIAEAGGQATGLPANQLDQLEESVQSATVDVFTGADDNLLRRLDLGLELDDPEGEGSVSLSLSIALSEVNEEQDFEAPEDPQPLDQLLPGGLGPFGGMPPGGGGGGGGAGAGGGIAPPDDAYLECLQEAGGDAEAVNECAALLGQG